MPIDLSELFADGGVRRNVANSALVIVAILVLRWLAVRLVRGAAFAHDAQRLTWLARVRLVTVAALVLGLAGVWATQLETVALSAVAFAAAVVLATKELILCLTGAAVRTAGDSFDIGDRIEVAGVRGDVISYGLLTTTLLEVGPGHRRTGRAITLPNALFVSVPVVNETFQGHYVLHTFSVPLGPGVDWERAEEELLAAAREACAEFQAAAQRAMQDVAERHGLTAPTADARVLVQVPDGGRVVFQVRVPSPASEKSRTEQRVLRRYLAWESRQTRR